jgi:hypothetical protein
MAGYLCPVDGCSVMEIEEGGLLVARLFALPCHLFGVFSEVSGDDLLLQAHLVHRRLLLHLLFVCCRLFLWLFRKDDLREGLWCRFDFHWFRLAFDL